MRRISLRQRCLKSFIIDRIALSFIVIFGEIGRIASKGVVLRLIVSKCIPLFYMV